MSKRTADADKAIRLAWEREQKLVKEGKGTRDWTKEQQQDILDPNKGKAYDDQGRAFQGQHMCSVSEYPEYQGNPDNIQFLTREEHLEAHKGNWQTPTNWYYDPISKKFTNFGDGGIETCKIIKLSNPINLDKIINTQLANLNKNILQDVKKKKVKNNSILKRKFDIDHTDEKQSDKRINGRDKFESINNSKNKSNGKISKLLKAADSFIKEYPEEFIGFVEILIRGIARGVQLVCGNGNRRDSDNISKVTDVEKNVNKISLSEHEVSEHKQRYHTKDGVKWKEKRPYHRGGKNN
jgi:hypothetical protein